MKASPQNDLQATVDVVREHIVSHVFPPGSKLKEEELCRQFGISRARLREALILLEARGLVERVRHQGAHVTRLCLKKTNDLFEMRSVLEGLAVRLATEKAPPETWNELIQLFGEPAETAVGTNDMEFYSSCVDKFRAQTIKAADNALLENTLDTILDQTKILIRRLAFVPGRPQAGLKQNRAILKAMQMGDSLLAEKLKRENIKQAQADYQRYENLLR